MNGPGSGSEACPDFIRLGRNQIDVYDKKIKFYFLNRVEDGPVNVCLEKNIYVRPRRVILGGTGAGVWGGVSLVLGGRQPASMGGFYESRYLTVSWWLFWLAKSASMHPLAWT